MDADVCDPGLQHEERERAVHHLRQLRPQRQPVRPRRHGQQPGEIAIVKSRPNIFAFHPNIFAG